MSDPFPLQPLAAPLSEIERAQLLGTLRELLLWQRELRRWPTIADAPDATPIVSLYARGALCGCAGVSDGPPAERILRAFVQALGDGRFGGLGSDARAELRCELSYALQPRSIELAQVVDTLEVGTHGLAVTASGRPVTLLPDVAWDNSLDAEGMLETLERKSGASRADWPSDGLFLFETESMLARQGQAPELNEDPVGAAAAWLAERVDADGHVTFGVSPRSAQQSRKSPMFHGRAAILVRALLSQVRGRGAAARARRWLE
ncbi:MAG TPA: AMMECR1 domain-containing protein, partial [Polyangiaceae bacterium]|nr:AMMECR1 domain-containing protein [Polyangiaceae bacterium]